MPVDPEIRTFLDQISALNEIDLDKISPQMFRETMDSSGVALRNSVVDIGKVEDFEIPVNNGTITARLYTPDAGSDSLIVYFHGGGFVFGNTDSYDNVCRFISKHSGSKVLSVNYRLAPEHKFPTAVDDALAAYKWALTNISKMGVVPEKIAISGDSAGGNLCASISLICRDNRIRLPKFQALFYPVVAPDIASHSHREFSNGLFLTGKMSAWFMKQYVTSREDLLDPRYNILGAEDLSGLPETLVITAEFDMLRDQGETFVSKLKEHGTKATGIRALGMVHGFISFYELSNSANNLLSLAARLMGDIFNR